VISRRDNPKPEQILRKFRTKNFGDMAVVIKKDDPEHPGGTSVQPMTVEELDKLLQKQPGGTYLPCSFCG